MPRDERHTATIPYGTLGIIPLASCTKMGEKVDKFLVDWREQREHESESTLAFNGYKRDSYILDARTQTFGSREAKDVLKDSVRGSELSVRRSRKFRYGYSFLDIFCGPDLMEDR